MQIYYHADFDGITSCVILMDFFRSRKKRITNLIPVNYNTYKNWRGLKISARDIAVVDFAYHPQALWWFDHHLTAIRDLPLFDDREGAIFSGKHLWFNYECASCAGWISQVLPRYYNFAIKASFNELIYWSDVIDVAAYESVTQIIESREPALQIETALRGELDAKLCNMLVNGLLHGNMEEVVRLDYVKSVFAEKSAQQDSALKEFGRVVTMDGPIVTFEYLSRAFPHNRFFPYYYYPEADYSAGIVRIKDGYKLEIGRNPWLKTEGKFNVGAFCSLHGGGGHYNVGGVRVDSLAKAREILSAARSQIKECLTRQEA